MQSTRHHAGPTKRIEILGAAKLNVIKVQQKQKRLHDKKHAHPSGFEVGDLVRKEDKNELGEIRYQLR